jgi:hypothetical protein
VLKKQPLPSKSPIRSRSPFSSKPKPYNPSQSAYRNINNSIINYKIPDPSRAKENVPLKQSVQSILNSAYAKQIALVAASHKPPVVTTTPKKVSPSYLLQKYQ